MDLNLYLNMTGESQKQFATRIGITQSVVSLYCNKKREPRPEILRKIEDITAAKVNGKDFSNKNKLIKKKKKLQKGQFYLDGRVMEVLIKEVSKNNL